MTLLSLRLVMSSLYPSPKRPRPNGDRHSRGKIDRFRHLMQTNRWLLFVGIPVVTNALMIGLYFSGVKQAQELVAPTIEWLPWDSWREFGILEQLQNIYLIITLGLLSIAAVRNTAPLVKTLFVAGALVTLFLFLEEIDYGIHFHDFVTGQASEVEVRNWHNQRTLGKQNVRFLKPIKDTVIIVWFILFPLFANRISHQPVKRIIPSRWFIAGFAVAFIASRFAHHFSGLGWGVIDGVPGNLKGNTSEFREASTFYLYMLYAL